MPTDPPEGPHEGEGGTFQASSAMLLHMFAQPVGTWARLSTDRCDHCSEWLEACWTLALDQSGTRGSIDLARYHQRYQVIVRCLTCGTSLRTQHSMVRNS